MLPREKQPTSRLLEEVHWRLRIAGYPINQVQSECHPIGLLYSLIYKNYQKINCPKTRQGLQERVQRKNTWPYLKSTKAPEKVALFFKLVTSSFKGRRFK